MHSSVHIAVIQLQANPDDLDFRDLAEQEIRAAAKSGAQIIALPELFAAPYFCQTMTPENFRYAEKIPGPTTDRFAALAKELGVVIMLPLFEECAPGLYFNTAAVVDADGTYLGKYRKTHIPDDPLYYEKFHFTPGDLGIRVFATKFAKIGVLICWDQWYPEAARLAALQGADLLVYPTAIGTIESEGAAEHARQLDAWRTVQRGHAVANGIFVVAINRVGVEGELKFWGNSFVAGPQGEFLYEAPGDAAANHVVELDLNRLREVRDMWPFFRDRRIDLFGPLTSRFLVGND